MMILGQSIQQDLELVGVHLMLKPVAFAPFLEAIRQPKTVPLFFFGWEADFPDPAEFSRRAALAQTMGRATTTPSSATRASTRSWPRPRRSAISPRRYALYRSRPSELSLHDAPWVFLYYPITYEIRQPWVHGYVLNPMRPTRLEHVWLSPHAAR